jgi:ubiquinone/menaquinone biosynthesis C-methylase UbiE
MELDSMTDAQEYKKHITGVFTRSSATYDQVGPRFFSRFGKGLVEFAGISPGARVLNVACGRGAVLFPALQAVGPGGEVVGSDLSEGMVQEIRRDIERLDAQALARYRQHATELIRQEKTAQGIPDTWRLHYSKGRKAE